MAAFLIGERAINLMQGARETEIPHFVRETSL
jgi:hypothetical protein